MIRESPGPEGIVLAGALRDVMLWVETPASERKAAFEPSGSGRRVEQIKAARLDEDLWVPTLTLAGLVAEPCGADSRRLLYACQRVVSWAEERGRPATKLAFAQAAALLRPGDAKLALEVARLARELGEQARAESWFRHTVRLTRANDWETYVWAYVGLGVLYIRAGNLAGAQTVMLRALKTATRHRLRPLAGVAHHHLFHLTVEKGHLSEAYLHARAALGAYLVSSDPALAGLAADVGRFWMQVDEAGRALSLFEQAVPALSDPNVRAMVSANSAWAAATLDDRSQYEALRARTVELIDLAVGRTRLDEAYVLLAYADLRMDEWDRAHASAQHALRLSQATGNAEVRVRAESLRENVKARVAGVEQRRIIEGPVIARQADSLASEFIQAFAKQMG